MFPFLKDTQFGEEKPRVGILLADGSSPVCCFAQSERLIDSVEISGMCAEDRIPQVVNVPKLGDGTRKGPAPLAIVPFTIALL
jgi:hypothetical protein